MSLTKVATPREMILAIGVTLVLLIVFMKVLYKPLSARIEGVKSNVKLVKTEKDNLQKQVDILKRQKQEQTQASSQRTSSNVKLQIIRGEREPSVKNISQLIGQISGGLSHEGILLESLTTQSTLEKTGYQRTPLIIKANGPFTKVTTFLDSLDQFDGLISIDILGLEIDPKIPGEMSLELSATFFQLEGIHAPITAN